MQLRNRIAVLLCAAQATWCVAQERSNPAGGPIQPTSASQSPQAAEPNAAHPLAKPIQIGRVAVQNSDKLTDYTATLYRKMWLDSEYGESSVRMKFRTQPFSVYLFFNQPNPGREVLFINGWNNNKMLAHEGSGWKAAMGSLSLDPNGAMAMEGSKYPITRIGLSNLARSVVEQWEREARIQDPSQIEVKLYPEARLADTDCKVVETTHRKRVQGLQFHKTRLFLTREKNIPFAVQQFAFPNQPGAAAPKVEDVRYQNLKMNVGLSRADFDPKNPNYKF